MNLDQLMHTITGYLTPVITAIQEHPALLIPAVIVFGFVANAVFSAVRTAVTIGIVILVCAVLAGTDLSGLLQDAGKQVEALPGLLKNLNP